MAAPVDAARATTNITSAVDPWTVNLPGSIAAGDLLFAHVRSGGNVTFNLPSGWTVWDMNVTVDASDDVTSLIYRVADGTESGTFSWDLSASAKGAAIVHRITGAQDPGTAPTATGSRNEGTGANANPAAVSSMASTNDKLILVHIGLDGETQTFTAPTNYANLAEANSGTGGAAATNCRTAAATRQLTTETSEDPGAWTHAAPSSGWQSHTSFIYAPSAAATDPRGAIAEAKIYNPALAQAILQARGH